MPWRLNLPLIDRQHWLLNHLSILRHRLVRVKILHLDGPLRGRRLRLVMLLILGVILLVLTMKLKVWLGKDPSHSLTWRLLNALELVLGSPVEGCGRGSLCVLRHYLVGDLPEVALAVELVGLAVWVVEGMDGHVDHLAAVPGYEIGLSIEFGIDVLRAKDGAHLGLLVSLSQLLAFLVLIVLERQDVVCSSASVLLSEAVAVCKGLESLGFCSVLIFVLFPAVEVLLVLLDALLLDLLKLLEPFLFSYLLLVSSEVLVEPVFLIDEVGGPLTLVGIVDQGVVDVLEIATDPFP